MVNATCEFEQPQQRQWKAEIIIIIIIIVIIIIIIIIIIQERKSLLQNLNYIQPAVTKNLINSSRHYLQFLYIISEERNYSFSNSKK